MKWLYRMERKYGRFGINNLMLYITITMLCVFVMDLILPLNLYNLFALNRGLLFQGQIWRIITFIFLPPNSSLLFVFLSLYFYYFIGNTLEKAWSPFLFTSYYLIGVLSAIVAGLISGFGSNVYLNLSLFFAFAQLFPDQQVMLFFVIPIKIKYLAYFNWVFFLISLITGSWPIKISILLSLLNFFLFFGKDVISQIKSGIKNYKNRQKYKNNKW